MSNTKPSLEAIYDYLKVIDGKVDSLEKNFTARFEALEKRIDSLDEKFVKLSLKLDDVILAHADLKAELKIISRRLERLELHSNPTQPV